MMTLTECPTRLYEKGQFMKCEKKLNQKHHLENCITEQWATQNNIIVCRFNHQVDGDEKKKTVEDFKSLLDQMHVLPPTRETITTELSVCVNMCTVYIMRGVHQCTHTLTDVVRRALTRVLRCLRFTAEEITHSLVDLSVSLTHIVHKYITMPLPIMPLLHVLKYRCLLDSLTGCDVTKTITVMREIIHALPSDKIEEKSPCFLITPPAQSSPTNVSSRDGLVPMITDPVHVIMTSSLYRERRLSDCSETVKRIRGEEFTYHRKYIEALLSVHHSDYNTAMTTLHSVSHVKDVPGFIKARIEYTTALCLANMNKPHHCIQKCKQSLETDFSFSQPMYLIATQYDKLGHTDLELEILSLLVKCLQEPSTPPTYMSIEDRLFMCVCEGEDTITLTQAVYLLAKTCLKFKRYDKAAENYVYLIDRLKKDNICSTPSTPTSGILSPAILPAPMTIYTELALCLYRLGRRVRAVETCDCVIDRQTSFITQRSTDTILSSFKSVANATQRLVEQSSQMSRDAEATRKRLRSQDDAVIACSPSDGVEGEELKWVGPEVVAMVIKALCMKEDSDYVTANEFITRALDVVEQKLRQLIQEDSTRTGSDVKRQRVNSGSVSVAPCDTSDLPPNVRWWLLQLYSVKCQILIAQEKIYDLLHYSRLGLHLQPDHPRCVYYQCCALNSLRRQQESATLWRTLWRKQQHSTHQISDNIFSMVTPLTEEEISFMEHKYQQCEDKHNT